MNRLRTLVCVTAFVVCTCSAKEGITVHNAWMRPTPQGENGAVYFVLQNSSGATDELVAASTSIAESVEIHESSMAEITDVMQMKQVFSVPLERGSEAVFEPGRLHMMLVNVNRSLAVGETIDVTLHFINHEDLPVIVSITEFAPAEEHSH